jgi:hypothetical protein
MRVKQVSLFENIVSRFTLNTIRSTEQYYCYFGIRNTPGIDYQHYVNFLKLGKWLVSKNRWLTYEFLIRQNKKLWFLMTMRKPQACKLGQ